MPMVCPNCQQVPRQVQTKFGVRNQCDRCRFYSFGNNVMVPMETAKWRSMGHRAFDPLWHGPDAKLSRNEAYRRLKWLLPRNVRSHWSQMSIAEIVIALPLVPVIYATVVEPP